MEIKTKRLFLREYVAEDFEAMLAYESDPEVVKYVCYGPYSPEECQAQLDWHIAHQSAVPRIYYHLGIVLPQQERLIGYCGLEMISEQNQEAELGYSLHRDFWGRGYMTEAVLGMMQEGFRELGLHRIFATCDPANVASIRVLEKVGIRYEGCLKAQKWCKGRWRDRAVYAILQNEFKF